MTNGEERETAPGDESATVSEEGSRSRALPIVLGGLAIVAIAVLGFLFVQANSGKTDAENALEESQALAGDLEQQLTSAEDNSSDLEGEVSTLKGQLDESAADLATAEAAAEEAEEVEAAVSSLLATSFQQVMAVSVSESECVAEFLIEANGAGPTLDAFVGAAQGPSAPLSPLLSLGADLVEAAESCGVEDVLGFGQTTGGYGDDPVLDALYDDCVAGSGTACDRLFLESPFGSEYERFGLTCGDRFEIFNAPPLCEGEI